MNSPTMSNNPALPESTTTTTTTDPFSDDIDQFAKTVANIKSKNVRPDLLPSIITHFASKWLPELCSASDRTSSSSSSSPASATTAAWLKKRFLVENLIGILPVDSNDSMPCDFLLRLLRAANMVGAGPAYAADVEARVACQLDRASLNELMIPAFNHTSGTLLDVGMVVRMVGKFMGMERSGAATVKVAKLVDLYMAEVALDAGLTVEEFGRLAGAVPGHARAVDDGVYRAVDTYIKAHPNITKQEKKALSKLIEPRKLTPEASLHAIHNDRLPIRSVIHVLFSEQSRLSRMSEWSGNSFNGARSPNISSALEAPGRCPSKREVVAQQHEMRKLKEDVGRLQTHCRALQAQIDRLSSEKKKKSVFRWSSFLFRINGEATDRSVDDYEVGNERRTPVEGKKGRMANGKGSATPKWRNSLS